MVNLKREGKKSSKILGFSFLIFFFLFGIILVDAFGYNNIEEDDGTFQDGTNIELRQLCDNCSFVNITSVVYPNGTAIVIGEVAMTRDGTEYNYTLASTYTNTLGVYNVNGYGDDNGANETWAYTFEITESGKDGVAIEWVLIFVIVFAYFIIGFGFYIEQHPPIIMGAIILLMTALYIFMNGFGILGAQSLLPQFVGAANLVVGAALGLKALDDLA